MKAELTAAFRRLCRGTGLAFEAFGHWLSAESHAPDRHSLRTDAAWLGRVLLRFVVTVCAAIFWAQLVSRAPYLIYAVPFVWIVTAWQMSDWSATPPPQEWRPSCRKCAGQELLSVTPSESQKGLLIYSFALARRPGHTHLHVVKDANTL